ncbi:GNAT family N-acetyltransferase [Paenibacillus artemisiicola]|nr:GNAT family N-acetyltransferase [Paenibacillus artemisiicola]
MRRSKEGRTIVAGLLIKPMQSGDAASVYEALNEHGIGKPLDYIERCWQEQDPGRRTTLIAWHEERFAGWLHLLQTSVYPPFAEQGIPEINNFDVVPARRRLGIGNALMDAIEARAFERSAKVGIGVGLYHAYGNAQRLYAKRGYIPDGRGIADHGVPVEPETTVYVGHELALWLIKERPAGSAT